MRRVGVALGIGLALGYLLGRGERVARGDAASFDDASLRVEASTGMLMCAPVYKAEDGTWKPWPAPTARRE